MNKRLKSNLQLVGIVIVIIILDQITKNIVRENLAFGETWMPLAWLAPYARFVHWQNTGAAFGIFQSGNQILKVLTSIIAVVITIYYQQVPFSQKLIRIAMSMMVGGAIGNLIDRFTQGFVTDFVSLGNFAVFNVADSCVTVGVGLMILAMLLEEVKSKRNGDQAKSSEDSFVEPQEDSNDL